MSSFISTWLSQFQSAWMEKDFEKVLNLFSDNVEYWETPFLQLKNKQEIFEAWQMVKTHEVEKLEFELKLSEKNIFTVAWVYKRSNVEWRGLYLVRLNENGLCDYFFQCGETYS